MHSPVQPAIRHLISPSRKRVRDDMATLFNRIQSLYECYNELLWLREQVAALDRRQAQKGAAKSAKPGGKRSPKNQRRRAPPVRRRRAVKRS